MEAWKQAVINKDVKTLCQLRFDFTPTPKQCEIIKAIAYKEHRRIIINCFTRYGKTQSVALGVGLYIGFNKHKKVYLISATDEQAGILRNYLANILVKDPILRSLVEEKTSGAERLRKELSRKRITFKNGCELITISAQGEADRLLGHGGDLVIEDEACKIKKSTYTGKISRMLGDAPDSMLVEISNPWTTDNHYFEHWNNPRWHKIHVGWSVGLTEGRITQSFVEEQQESLTPTEFQVLYESRFPDQAEDALYNLAALRTCMEHDFHVRPVDVIIACDVADKGLDETVILKAITDGHHYKVIKAYSEPKSEQTSVAGRILAWQQEPPTATKINIDCIGYGAGVVSMVREGLPVTTCKVNACHYGQSPRNKRRFMNRKAEEYFVNAAIINEKRIILPKNDKILRDCLGITWEFTSNSKIRVKDPENKSPDWSDALVYLTWHTPTQRFGLA